MVRRRIYACWLNISWTCICRLPSPRATELWVGCGSLTCWDRSSNASRLEVGPCLGGGMNLWWGSEKASIGPAIGQTRYVSTNPRSRLSRTRMFDQQLGTSSNLSHTKSGGRKGRRKRHTLLMQQGRLKVRQISRPTSPWLTISSLVYTGAGPSSWTQLEHSVIPS
jgi:hypothetical protein